MQYCLGIKPVLRNTQMMTWGGHDPGACLIGDGKIIAIAEEERFCRIKRAPRPNFPEQSIDFVLDRAGVELSDIDAIAIGRDHGKYFEEYSLTTFIPRPYNLHAIIPNLNKYQRYKKYQKEIHITQVKNKLSKSFESEFSGEWIEVPHHRCHATSAAYCSDFTEQVVITMDGRGETDSTVIWDDDLNRINEFPADNSLGHFYSAGCWYLGFRGQLDAGKVMGLASYGNYRKEFEEFFSSITTFGDGAYDVSKMDNRDYEVAVEQLGPSRNHTDKLTQRHKDFAYHLQKRLEEIVTHLVEYYTNQLGPQNVALAGGVAMNCKLNRTVLDMDCVDELFIQPAANDSGICLGAALGGYYELTDIQPQIDLSHLYYGPEYSDEQIQSTIEASKLTYETYDEDEICKVAAKLLANGHLVGWYQGRMEFGARALGNRSILADPRSNDSLDNVNANVKDREEWRPFAPSLLYEAKDEYLVNGDESPFMILLDSVPESKQDEVPAITHVDGTTRPQTVTKSQNSKYHRLIKEFENLTGVPVVLNTSFNVSGEPIVESPEQAIADFYTTGLDSLVIGNHLLTKAD